MQSETLRPTWADVSLAALGKNLHALRSHLAGAPVVIAVVKADAYGHGLVPIAQALQSFGVAEFAVASVDEAITLRRNGIRSEILVFGGLQGVDPSVFLEHDLLISGIDIQELERLAALDQRVRIHLKIDTGMNRVGIRDLAPCLELLRRTPAIEVCGVYSHLIHSGVSHRESMRTQYAQFLSATAELHRAIGYQPLRHLLNSTGILAFPEGSLDAVRAGLLLYGIAPDAECGALSPEYEPVLSLSSRVIQVKRVREGEGVSYGHTFVATRDTTIATVPIGYGDGFSRQHSNAGKVLINDTLYSIAGRVCMDLLMVDVGEGDVRSGDEAVLIGAARGVMAHEVAGRIGTTPHEVTTTLTARVGRRYL